MATNGILPHWLDLLPPPLVNHLAGLFMKLQLSQLKNAKEVFDKVQLTAEQCLGTHHLVADKLALKLSFELKRHLSPKDASWFMDRRLERAGANHFGGVLNVALLSETKSGEYSKRLLDIANRERDAVKQLLTIVLTCKSHEQKKNYEKSRAVYEKIGDLVTRVYTPKSWAQLNDESKYFYVTACEELAFLHMKHGREDLRLATLREALKILDTYNNQLDWSMQVETLLIRALKNSFKREEIIKQCGNLLTKIMTAISKSDDQDFLLKYSKCVRGAYMEVAITLRARDNRALADIGEALYEKMKKILGETHHEVILLAAQLANLYFHLGNVNISREFIKIAETGVYGLDNEAKAVMYAKVRSAKLLCKLYHAMKQPEEAESYCFEEMRLNSRIYGDRHHFVANSLQTLACIYKEQGKKAEALVCLQESLEMMRECQPKFVVRHKEIEAQIQEIEKLNNLKDIL